MEGDVPLLPGRGERKAGGEDLRKDRAVWVSRGGVVLRRREQGQRFLFFGFYQVELEKQH